MNPVECTLGIRFGHWGLCHRIAVGINTRREDIKHGRVRAAPLSAKWHETAERYRQADERILWASRARRRGQFD